jgi:AAA family ATP:ADP antiporter
MEAIKLAERKKIIAALPLIEKIVSERSDDGLLPEAVKAMCMLQPEELDSLDAFVADKDQRLMKAAITGLMISGGISAVVTAGQRLLQLIGSTNPVERRMAAEIIGDLGVQSFYKPLVDLLKDENPEVLQAAIIAAGKVKKRKVNPAAIAHVF